MTREKLIAYQNWIIYQIYPKSFADANGDGIGDLQGIISRLDYIKGLSVDAIWLSPCFPSPNDDNGYDISDYRDIAPEYGSLRDMDELIQKAHGLGIKIILDLVANHTSTAHRWFQESRKDRKNAYADYYYWSDTPRNDWKSVFSNKSAWIYDEARKQYYLASFAPTQADLNWENAQVRKEICDIVDFWIDRGVDGFRCDVLDMISKEFDNPNGNGNGRRIHEYIRQLFGREKTKDIFTVGECWGPTIENMNLFCGLEREELCCSFQNDHRAHGIGNERYTSAPYSLSEVARSLSKWQRATLEGDLLYALFWENHDSPRIISRFGDEKKRYESCTMLATMLYLLSGVAFLFQGQELGLINTKFQSIDCYDDIEARAFYEENRNSLSQAELFNRINAFGRDNARRMMPWTGEKASAWIKTDESQLRYSVAAQEQDQKSVLQYFRRLLAFRKEYEVFSRGEYREVAITDEYFLYERAYKGKVVTVVCVFKDGARIEGLEGKVVLSNLGRTKANGAYEPYECAVLEG